MTLSQEEKRRRRESWQAIRAAINKVSCPLVMGVNDKLMRRYYVGGEILDEAKYGDGQKGNLACYDRATTRIPLIVRLMCEPQADLARWEALYQEYVVPDDHREYPTGKGHFVDLMYDPDFYFGRNTLFAGREREIQDYFFGSHSLYPLIQAGEVHSDLVSNLVEYTSGLLYQLSLVEPVKYNPFPELIVEGLERVSEQIRLTREDLEEGDIEYLSYLVNPVEYACRYSERMPADLARLAQSARKSLRGENGDGILGSIYDEVVEEMFAKRLEYPGIGASVTLCVRYQTQKQRDSMIECLYSESRYPYGDDRPVDVVRKHPYRGEWKASYQLIRLLWRDGFDAESHELADDRTLIIKFRASLEAENFHSCISRLHVAVEDVRGSLKSRKVLPHDEIGLVESCDYVYHVKPVMGRERFVARSNFNRDENSTLAEFTGEILEDDDRLGKRRAMFDNTVPLRQRLLDIMAHDLDWIVENGAARGKAL